MMAQKQGKPFRYKLSQLSCAVTTGSLSGYLVLPRLPINQTG